MLRIIYQHPLDGYQVFDSHTPVQLIAYEHCLCEQFCHVICIVDYNKRIIFNKCDNFKIHRDQVDELIFDPRYTSPE